MDGVSSYSRYQHAQSLSVGLDQACQWGSVCHSISVCYLRAFTVYSPDTAIAWHDVMRGMMRSWQTLDMRNCQLGQNGLMALLEGVRYNRSLISVDVSGAGLGPTGTQMIVQFMRQSTDAGTLQLQRFAFWYAPVPVLLRQCPPLALHNVFVNPRRIHTNPCISHACTSSYSKCSLIPADNW